MAHTLAREDEFMRDFLWEVPSKLRFELVQELGRTLGRGWMCFRRRGGLWNAQRCERNGGLEKLRTLQCAWREVWEGGVWL